MMSEISKSLFPKPFFASSILLFKWIYLNTSRDCLETITQCACKDEFSLASEGLLIGFWATSPKTLIHLIMLSLYLWTQKSVFHGQTLNIKQGRNRLSCFRDTWALWHLFVSSATVVEDQGPTHKMWQQKMWTQSKTENGKLQDILSCIGNRNADSDLWFLQVVMWKWK